MEKQILDLLVEMNERLIRLDERLIKVEDTVNRIEASQLKMILTKKKTDFELDYLNNRLTEMDKRIFNIERELKINY